MDHTYFGELWPILLAMQEPAVVVVGTVSRASPIRYELFYWVQIRRSGKPREDINVLVLREGSRAFVRPGVVVLVFAVGIGHSRNSMWPNAVSDQCNVVRASERIFVSGLSGPLPVSIGRPVFINYGHMT